MNKKIFAVVGIVLTLLHLVVYYILQYHWLFLLIGFGVIYLVFVLPMKNKA